MNWLQRCEDTLTNLEAEPLPDDLGEIQILIKVCFALISPAVASSIVFLMAN